MRKFLLPLIFLMVLLATGCQVSNKKLAFTGEGDSWSAQLLVEQNEGDETYHIQLDYKGDNLDEVEPFHYHITSPNEEIDYTGHNAKLNEKGIFENDLLVENSSSTNEKNEFVIHIQWNGKSEMINLRKN